MNSTRQAPATKWTWPVPSNRQIVWGFMIFGILLRLRQYLFDRSLWLDESLLVLNIISRSATGLLRPLDDYQAAPIGFLLLEKLAVCVLGSGEMALRLVPFLCGIASLFLFAIVARRFLAPVAVPIAVGLFAISDRLIYYSSEAKQYSCDVAVVLVLYVLAGSLLEAEFGILRITLVSVVGGLAIWFSQSAAFILAGLGLSLLWISARKNDRPALLQVLIPATIWSCSFLVYYLVSLSHLAHDVPMREYWQGAFAPFPPSSFANVWWYVDAFFGIFSDPVGLMFVGIAAVACVLGAMDLFAEHQGTLLLLLLPVAVTLLVSAFRLYPFQGRLLLFITPAVFLLIAAGLGVIQKKALKDFPAVSVLLVGFLFLHPLVYATWHLFKPKGVEEIRPVIQYMEKHRSEGDVFYVYYSSTPSLEYYRQRGLIGQVDQITGIESRQNWRAYREDLDKLRGNKRVWILFSHVYRAGGVDEEQLFVDYLDSVGTRLDDSRASGASVYLYDLSTRRP